MITINLEKPVAFYPQLAKALGGIEEALFLQQILYWSDRGRLEDKWVYKTKEELEEETCLTRKQQDRIREKLVNMGVLEVELRIVKSTNKPVLHYRVNEAIVQKVLMQKYQMDDCNSTKGTKHYTENTTENTTDTSNDKIIAGVVKSNTETNNKIAEVIDLFKGIDILNYKSFFGNKTERKACEELLSVYSLEEIKNRIVKVPEYNKMKYVSESKKIYKPSELKRNWVAMENKLKETDKITNVLKTEHSSKLIEAMKAKAEKNKR